MSHNTDIIFVWMFAMMIFVLPIVYKVLKDNLINSLAKALFFAAMIALIIIGLLIAMFKLSNSEKEEESNGNRKNKQGRP